MKTIKGLKVGFIGLGNMGWAMARHLHQAGADLTVWNRSERRRQEAADHGIQVAPSPGEVAEVTGDGILCFNLTYADIIASLLDGMEDHLAAGVTIIDFGTTGHAATVAMANRISQAGGSWVDAPVSGGQVGAEAANLTIMCGGDESAYQRALPVLKVLGEKITHLGPVGSGQVTKFANQLIVAQTIDAVAQALRLAELAGVDSSLVREALRGGFAESRILELHGERMVNRDFAPGGRSELQLKDVRLMSELAEQVGLESKTLKNSLKLWEHFVDDLGHGDLDHSGLFKIYEK